MKNGSNLEPFCFSAHATHVVVHALQEVI